MSSGREARICETEPRLLHTDDQFGSHCSTTDAPEVGQQHRWDSKLLFLTLALIRGLQV